MVTQALVSSRGHMTTAADGPNVKHAGQKTAQLEAFVNKKISYFIDDSNNRLHFVLNYIGPQTFTAPALSFARQVEGKWKLENWKQDSWRPRAGEGNIHALLATKHNLRHVRNIYGYLRCHKEMFVRRLAHSKNLSLDSHQRGD
ncbi:uncharacterized protein F4822DRAFT_420928 [Hypoxylon trugodes]|uniref:uncharacterized protein n=1 Tax=Hypoxylon trugodes TaxID=326681 RepID=UPI00218C9569|nr:uncharacterized protein F4822DRAFT_420928 [Hypoxylon trugodes]KAI1383541.1 hypothetical protein F4822DRAFT_420928 [Hypoxylon trugodes]